ncbi:MAG: M20/M25/M40 family metallo-hydrolase [Eubacterium sp.]|nr:M20/M25/M40 family metallo-hydrolase [Eubacterium sp.]
MNNTLELLKELTQTVGVSGCEENIVNLLKEKLAPYGNVTVYAINNVFCTFGEGYHFLLDAHLDEIGLIVTEITDDDFIKFSKCGGIDTRPLPALEVSIWGREEVKGIISTLPPHLQSADDEKNVPKLTDLAIDTGCSKEQLEKLVSLGDRITFKRNFTPLLNNYVSASCLDDRSGVAAILMSLDELKKLPCKITVMFSSQEEVGTRGAKTGVFAKNADEAISVDVSFAMSPGCDKSDCGELSKGPMIGFSPTIDKSISRMLVDVAEKENIPYQYEIMSGRTGTNADVIAVSENGIKTALISIPERYMHQRVEVVDVNDIENVSKLICAYIRERVGDINA